MKKIQDKYCAPMQGAIKGSSKSTTKKASSLSIGSGGRATKMMMGKDKCGKKC